MAARELKHRAGREFFLQTVRTISFLSHIHIHTQLHKAFVGRHKLNISYTGGLS